MSQEFMIISQACGSILLCLIIAWQWTRLHQARVARCTALAQLAAANTRLRVLGESTARYSSLRCFLWHQSQDSKQPYSVVVFATSLDIARTQARSMYIRRRLVVRYIDVPIVQPAVAEREANALFQAAPEIVDPHTATMTAFILNLPQV